MSVLEDFSDKLEYRASEEAYFFDATDLNCPLPVLKSATLLRKVLKAGQRLHVKTTDRSFEVDFLVLCDKENAVLENTQRSPHSTTFTILVPKR